MTDDDLQRERLLSYFNGYEAGKADAAKETCVGLTEADRENLGYCFRILRQHGYEIHAEDVANLLARSAQPADTVTVRREVLQRLMDFIDDTCAISDEGEAVLAEAEAALAAQPKGDAE